MKGNGIIDIGTSNKIHTSHPFSFEAIVLDVIKYVKDNFVGFVLLNKEIMPTKTHILTKVIYIWYDLRGGESMLKTYLMDNYGYNEPIFLNELSVEGLSENAVRQSIKRLVAKGFLERYDNGIYYIPKHDGLLDMSYLDPLVVIMRKYVQSKSEVYGYVTGISFVNQLGLTTQNPAVIEIVTNREATNGREITVGKQRVRVKKSATKISDSNAELLQFLDGIVQVEKYTERSMEETINILMSYMKKKSFTQKQLSEVSSVLTGTTAKKLIEWGMIYEFTQ